jgi:hypothetical protein
MSQWLIFLAIVPLSCMYLTKNMHINNKFMLNGIALGMVIAPVSFGLIQMSYIPFIGKLLGLIGVIVNLPHGSIGYISLLCSGTIEPNTLLTATELAMVNIFNGVLFGYVYGLIGYTLDKKLAKKQENTPGQRPPLHSVTS